MNMWFIYALARAGGRWGISLWQVQDADHQ
jgi:hypothetical protein